MKKQKENWIVWIYIPVFLLLFVLSMWLNITKQDLYLFGCIWRSNFINLLVVALSSCFITWSTTRGAEKKPKVRMLAMSLIFAYILYEICSGFLNQRDIVQEKIQLPDGKQILLEEKEESSGDYHWPKLTVYQISHHIGIKKCTQINENMFLNQSMIAEQQFTYEYDESSQEFCLLLDYDDLHSPLKWKEDAEPPAFWELYCTLE